MATNLDLEEQEQLDQLKHFWQQWGNAISTALAVIALVYLGYTGWNYWQRQQASQATVLFDTVERAQRSSDLVLMERAVSDIKDKFGGTVYASQAALLLSQSLQEKDRSDDAQTHLQWVVDHGADSGYQAIARLRLSAMLIDKKQNEAARQLLTTTVPAAYQPLVQDRLGDLAVLDGKKSDAVGLYQSAWNAMDPRAEYRRLLEIKLAALGVAPKAAPEANKP
jgi:predicted negative regulator of RcsB-dependent stress response